MSRKPRLGIDTELLSMVDSAGVTFDYLRSKSGWTRPTLIRRLKNAERAGVISCTTVYKKTSYFDGIGSHTVLQENSIESEPKAHDGGGVLTMTTGVMVNPKELAAEHARKENYPPPEPHLSPRISNKKEIERNETKDSKIDSRLDREKMPVIPRKETDVTFRRDTIDSFQDFLGSMGFSWKGFIKWAESKDTRSIWCMHRAIKKSIESGKINSHTGFVFNVLQGKTKVETQPFEKLFDEEQSKRDSKNESQALEKRVLELLVDLPKELHQECWDRALGRARDSWEGASQDNLRRHFIDVVESKAYERPYEEIVTDRDLLGEFKEKIGEPT